ncbi:MAG: lactonase family protein [Rhodoglobus sp.]
MSNPKSGLSHQSRWFVGGWGHDMAGTSHGISVARSKPDGSLELSHLAATVPSASFIVVDGDRVFATLEGSGAVVSFTRQGESLGAQTMSASGGEYPCHLTVHGNALIAANYGSGSLGVIQGATNAGAATTGTVQWGITQTVPATGSGPRPQQEGPHAHSSLFVDDRTLFTLDLGADRIRIFDYREATLTAVDEVVLPPGFGPRDIIARPGNLFYVLGELGLELIVFHWHAGALTRLCSSALPGTSDGDQASGIAISADGRFAYIGVRRSNLVAVLSLTDGGRHVTPLVAVSSEGDWPRHLALHDNILHVCNQFSNTIASFLIPENGIPQLIAPPIAVPSPTYLALID